MAAGQADQGAVGIAARRADRERRPRRAVEGERDPGEAALAADILDRGIKRAARGAERDEQAGAVAGDIIRGAVAAEVQRVGAALGEAAEIARSVAQRGERTGGPAAADRETPAQLGGAGKGLELDRRAGAAVDAGEGDVAPDIAVYPLQLA